MLVYPMLMESAIMGTTSQNEGADVIAEFSAAVRPLKYGQTSGVIGILCLVEYSFVDSRPLEHSHALRIQLPQCVRAVYSAVR